MPDLTIHLSPDELIKLEALALQLRRKPEAQAEVLVLEGLKMPLKAPPKGERETKPGTPKVAPVEDSTNGT